MSPPYRPESYRRALKLLLPKVEQLLDDCEIRAVPVNLYRIAKHQDIHRVRELDTRLDGQLLELESGGFEVILSRNAPLSRRRFTLAHEIAHTLLAQAEGGVECSDGIVEDLCNAMAAELLMPRKFLLNMFPRDKKISVETLPEMARSFGCSLEAAGWRLLNSGLVKGALLIWSLKKLEEKQVLELVGLPQSFGLKTPFKRGMQLRPGDSLWQTMMEDEPGVMKLKDLGMGQISQGEFIRLNKTVLMLLTIGEFHQDHRPSALRQGKLAFS